MLKHDIRYELVVLLYNKFLIIYYVYTHMCILIILLFSARFCSYLLSTCKYGLHVGKVLSETFIVVPLPNSLSFSESDF